MFGRALVASVLVASAATAAHADQRRGGMTGGAMVGGGPATSERFTGTGAGFALAGHLGWLAAATDGRFGAEAQLIGSQTWYGGRAHVDGVLLGALRLYPVARLAITFGLGVTAAENETESFVAGGAAFAASVGVELKRWRRSALSVQLLGYGGRFDDGDAGHLLVGIGIDAFGLSTPPR
jgi:hypothetical protein